MQPQPLYAADNVHPAFDLRYSWTGWPSRRPLPVNTSLLADLKPLWEGDGLRLLEHRWSDEIIQVTFSAPPGVSPVFLAARKGPAATRAAKSLAELLGLQSQGLREHGRP